MEEDTARRGGSTIGSREKDVSLSSSLSTSHGQKRQKVTPRMFPVTHSRVRGWKQAHEGFLQTSVFLLRTLHFSQVDTGGNLSWKTNRIPILYQVPLFAVEPCVEVLVTL